MDFKVGQQVSFKRIFSQRDFDRFADLSGDDNPIHVDPDFCANTRFGKTLAHGMFLYSNICCGLSSLLPGPGAIQLEQELMFPGPTFTGDLVEIHLEVIQVDRNNRLLGIRTSTTSADGVIGSQGHTLVRPPNDESMNFELMNEVLPPLESAAGKPGSAEMKGFRLGQHATTQRTFKPADQEAYADLTGDKNPIFLDHHYAKQQGLPGVIVPGPLLGGMFSFLLGTELPGRGTNWLKQKFRFPNACHPGELITANVEIIRLRPEKDLVNLRTICTNTSGSIVCEGEALVLAKEMETDLSG